MKISLIILGILFSVLGAIFTATVIGALLGIPMIIAGVILFILGLILPVRL